METSQAMGGYPFDILLARNLPHVIEKIFFSLDYDTFNNCQEVSMTWNRLLTSDSYLKIAKSVFLKDIEEDLWAAVMEDNLDGVRRVLSNGMAEANCESNRNFPRDLYSYPLVHTREMVETPLYYAARMGQQDVVKLLIERGADPNWRHRSGMTPLCLAAAKQYSNVVRLLLDAGADPNKKGLWGCTPLSFAERNESAQIRGDGDVANMLREAGAIIGSRLGYMPVYEI